jgi:PAS domain S-box-containing protein
MKKISFNPAQKQNVSDHDHRSFFELSAVGMTQVDVRTKRFLIANKKFCDITGYRRNELLKMTFLDITHPDDRKRDLALYKHALSGSSKEWISEKRYIRKDGQVIWVNVTGTIIFDEAGRPQRSVAFIENISERKKFQEELEWRKAEFEAMFNSISDAVIFADINRCIRITNSSFTAMFGYTSEEVRERTTEFLYADKRDYVRQGKKRYSVQAIGDPHTYEIQYRRKDGSVFWAESSGTQVKDASGRVLGFISAHRDITERVYTKEMLQKSHEELEQKIGERTEELTRVNKELQETIGQLHKSQDILIKQQNILEAFFKHTITPLVFLDRNFNFIRVNDAYAHACKRDVADFTGHNHFEFYPDKENETIFNKVVKTKEHFQAIARPFTFPDHPEWGTTFWDWTLVPILDDTGEVDFLIFSLKDVTVRKRTEDLLRDSEELLRRLSSELITAQEIERKRISRELHDDLGQALSLIKLRLGYIEEHLQTNQEPLKQHCADTIHFIDQTIEDVRRLSHDLSPSVLEDLGITLAIRKLIQGVVELHSNIHIDHTIVDIDQVIPKELHINLYRIIQEALTNILKHADARNISIVVKQEDGKVIVLIDDDGKGFDVQQALSVITVEKGLGLASIQERIRMIGGTLDINSQPGKGTRITLRIPAIIL